MKKQGHLVGYMGDGINDVPSLHEADVAISVDDAVDVAKEAANIVLLKSDLSVVLDGIVEGRRVFANTMKYIFIAVSANFGNMFSMAGASLLLKFLPLLPKQILMTNLLQDLPAMSLASDNADEGWITRPHRFNFKFIIKFMITFGLISSIFDYCMFAVLLHINANEQLFQTVWFTESVISAVMLMIVLRTTLPVVRSKPSKRLLLTSGFIIAFTAALSYLPFNHLLGFIPIPLFMWKYILGVIAIYMIVGELSKRLFYKYNRP
ncbi:HAD-IC family P-type ATPase [Dolosicoccus paucivorans]|uniref:HAD-IC family P-type ATPase n=1 Tax=Dolosicoccus paucivorans TaxID=84521 RepID=UPI0015E062A1|nr:HAD-IC family P-type ATPase [Dolosicoccus paucivorans]